MTKKLLMGNEAIAHAALEAGVGVVAGYPGTPSSEIVETVARQYARGAAHGVHVEWSTNEKVALELLFGASLAGKRGLFTCKQMGLNVASDALMSLNYVSVRGGLVLIVADDPGPISSQTEQDTRRFASFAKVPVLDPSTPEQAFDMVKAAFDLSEHFHTPVIVRPTTRINHASTFIDVQDETTALPPLEDGFQADPSRWVIFPRRAYEAHGEINKRLESIANVFSNEPTFSSFNTMDEAGESFTGEPTFGIMTSGITASYVREALRMINIRTRQAGIGVPAYRLMQIGTPFPFPEKAVSAFATGLADVLVLEELDSVLEDELAAWAGRTHAAFNIHGKRTGEARDRGENDVDDVMARIERFLGLTGRLSLYRFRGGENDPAPVQLKPRAEAELPERPPVLCAGCPHRGAFFAVKKALDDQPAVLCGDIGCYTLGNAKPLEALDTCLCMGGGVTMAQGISVADPDKKAIAYIGDSTFFASGMPGLANAAYNGHDITVMVLDNATTAMTGSQPHPGTGKTLMGDQNEPLDMEDIMLSNGITHVYHANPFDHDASTVAVRAALAFEGPSAVIFEGPCIQLVDPKPSVVINRDQCTGCKRCITTIGCPAISFNSSIKGARSGERGQVVVDASLCTGCGLCTQACPFHAIHGDPAVYRNMRASHARNDANKLEPHRTRQRIAGSARRILESGLALEAAAAASAASQADSAASASADRISVPFGEGVGEAVQIDEAQVEAGPESAAAAEPEAPELELELAEDELMAEAEDVPAADPAAEEPAVEQAPEPEQDSGWGAHAVVSDDLFGAHGKPVQGANPYAGKYASAPAFSDEYTPAGGYSDAEDYEAAHDFTTANEPEQEPEQEPESAPAVAVPAELAADPDAEPVIPIVPAEAPADALPLDFGSDEVVQPVSLANPEDFSGGDLGEELGLEFFDEEPPSTEEGGRNA